VLQKSGLAGVVVDAVRKGEIIYTGTSAGSMIAAKDVTLAQYDGGETEYLNLISDYRALGLVNFMIVPHSNNPECVESYKKAMEHIVENKTPLIFLNDDQAVFVEDDKFEIVGV
jgi:peptidase E